MLGGQNASAKLGRKCRAFASPRTTLRPPLGTLGGAPHVCATLPNFVALEFSTASDVPFWNDLIVRADVPRAG